MANCAAHVLGARQQQPKLPSLLGSLLLVQGLAVPKLPVENSTPSPGKHTLGKANISVRLSPCKMMCWGHVLCLMGFHLEPLNRKEVDLLNSTQLLLLQGKPKEWTPAMGWGRSAGSPTP